MPARSVKRWSFPIWRLKRDGIVHFPSILFANLPLGPYAALPRILADTRISPSRTAGLANRPLGQSV